MKKTIRFLATALCTVVLTTPMLFANDSNDVRSNYEKAFNQLTENSINALKVAENQGVAKTNLTVPKMQIVGVSVPTNQQTENQQTTNQQAGNQQAGNQQAGNQQAGNQQAGNQQAGNQQDSAITSTMGVKIWFKQPDGVCVNPIRKRWNPKEQLYINVSVAVPVYVAIFQNYPDSRPTSRQIYPDARYPESFKPLQPGQTAQLPVLFELDNDARDEIISIVIVRADSNPSDVNAFSVSSTTGTASATASNDGVTATATNSNGQTATATATNNTATATATNSNGQTATVTATNNTVTATATNNTVPAMPNGETVASNQVTSIGAGTMKSFVTNDEMFQAQIAVNIAKDVNSSNVTSTANATINSASAERSQEPNDVCTFLFGAGNVGQWQLTIKK